MLGEQQVARALALLRIADHDRHNMGLVQHDRQTRRGRCGLHARGTFLLAGSLRLRALQMANSGRCRRANCWRQRSGGSIGADRIDKVRATGNVTAQAAECLRERALITSMRCITPSRAAIPAPAGPYMPTAWTSSR